MTSTILLDPTGEHQVVTRKKAPRPGSLDGIAVGVLDIGKQRGDVYLDRVAELLTERGIAVERYRKPGPGKLVSAEVKSRMLSDVKAVVIGLAD
jgi:hypothetical protein